MRAITTIHQTCYKYTLDMLDSRALFVAMAVMKAPQRRRMAGKTRYIRLVQLCCCIVCMCALQHVPPDVLLICMQETACHAGGVSERGDCVSDFDSNSQA